ncbi:unnamed protein product [Caenorhabditis sp. 36 PRJEB53466]|nr:unnamed protein product [Caenorhabditis sp. 36 PRJEB53466]
MTQRHRSWEARNQSPPQKPLPPLQPVTQTVILCFSIDGPPSDAFIVHTATTLIFWLIFLFGVSVQRIAPLVPVWIPMLKCLIFFVFFKKPTNVVLNFALFHATFILLLCLILAVKYYREAFHNQGGFPSESALVNMLCAIFYMIWVPLAHFIIVPQLRVELHRKELQAQRDFVNRIR